jgi:hypothetical protein
MILKSVMNSIIYYAIENEIVEHNHLKDINYREFAYKPESHDTLPYSEKERKLMMNHLVEDLYSLSIKLDFSWYFVSSSLRFFVGTILKAITSMSMHLWMIRMKSFHAAKVIPKQECVIFLWQTSFGDLWQGIPHFTSIIDEKVYRKQAYSAIKNLAPTCTNYFKNKKSLNLSKFKV